MKTKKNLIVFRIIFNQTIGSGHLYHATALFEELDLKKFDVIFLLNSYDESIKGKISSQIETMIENNLEDDLLKLNIANYQSLYFVNDTLDTTTKEVDSIKKFNFKTICIEDRGEGANNADLVINALYSKCTSNPNEVYGPKYNLFRNEFYTEASRLDQNKSSDKILISFGGTDPERLTEKTIEYLTDLKIDNFRVINPPHRTIDNLKYQKWIIEGEVNVAKEINNSKFVVSSGGRTVYEANFLKKHSLVICQNNRELTHSCLKLDSVHNLGIFRDLDINKFSDGINTIENKSIDNFYNKWLSRGSLLNLILK